MEFIKVNNRRNFLISEISEFHPNSKAYLDYWKLHKKRCIEGFWSVDDANVNVDVNGDISEHYVDENRGKWRFMTGNCYFYVNYGTILHRPENAPKSAPKKKIRPLLRDIEWMFFYMYLTCRGFSGFSEDDEYSSNIELLNPETKVYHDTCYNSKGELKKYIEPREYLLMLHDKPLGYPLYENPALDLFILGPRGLGKSFIVGVGCVLYEIIFDGAKVYNDETIRQPYKVEVFVGSALSSKSADILKKTKEAMENLPGEYGQNTTAYRPSPFYKSMSGTLAPNNMKNPWRHEYAKKIGGSWKNVGSGSNVKHGVYTVDNSEAAAGGRYTLSVVEEWGLLANSLTVHGSNDATMQDAPWKFGTGIWIGTGGNVEKIQEGEIMFRDPKGFNALEFEDEWENSGKIGWFIPSYYAMNDYKDENGNTILEEAIKVRTKIRDEKLKAKDNSAYNLEIMNYPIKPSEMFSQANTSFFPQNELKALIAEIKTKPHKYENAHYYVEMTFNSQGTLEMEYKNSNDVVREFPIKNNKNKPGVIEIFEMPKKGSDDLVYQGRYVQGTDTYDDDESNTKSLGCTIVFDLWTDRIVAEYTGRRDSKEFYEITRQLNILYRTTHNYEKNKKGLFTYYENNNSVHLLADTPESLRDVENVNVKQKGNQAKGTHATVAINMYGLRLILNWLLSPAFGEDSNSEIKNYHKIKSLGIAQELANYGKGNYDRVSALIMVMIIREDKLKYITRVTTPIHSVNDDPFFNRSDNKLNVNNIPINSKFADKFNT